MREPETIEVLIAKELRGVCGSCTKFEICSYRKHAMKIIIQCELYEMNAGEQTPGTPDPIRLKGLCTNCGNAATCHLPEKQFGVWHCEEYR